MILSNYFDPYKKCARCPYFILLVFQNDLDLNVNVTYAVLITVKTKSLSNQHRTFSSFSANPLLRYAS